MVITVPAQEPSDSSSAMIMIDVQRPASRDGWTSTNVTESALALTHGSVLGHGEAVGSLEIGSGGRGIGQGRDLIHTTGAMVKTVFRGSTSPMMPSVTFTGYCSR